VRAALKLLFEEAVGFRTADGTPIDGDVYIGETAFEPVDVLRGDPIAYEAEYNTWIDEVWLPEQRDRRAEILAVGANAARYEDLCAAMHRRQVIPFVGSGMSVASGLPTWTGLLENIRGFTEVTAKHLVALLKDFKFEEAAEILSQGANARLFNERIEHELRLRDGAPVKGAVRLLPSLFPGVVITTNLDRLLETHYKNCGLEFEAVLVGAALGRFRAVRRDGAGCLIKLHGDCCQVEGRVLRTAEYDDAYRVGSAVREELELLYRNNNLLFLGCSLGGDRTIQLVAEVATRDSNMPRHYAFLQAPASPKQRRSREIFLTERGIFPIWYSDGHDASLACLLAGVIEYRLRAGAAGMI
jgi:hypothetical protein